MHAIVIDKFNEAGSVREMPVPQLAPNAIVVRVNVAGVNPIDWKVRDGKAGERDFPLVLGQDFAGVVTAAGSAVTRVSPGDRVFGCAREHGAYAEFTLVPDGEQASPFSRIPEGLDDEHAAALPTPALTALASLDLLEAGNGSDVLIVGAAGAVGAAAVQMAVLRGARVFAVVKPGQADLVRRFGAHQVVEAGDDFLDAVRSERPEPFAATLDLVSDGDTLKRHAGLYAKGGKVVTTIHVADEAWFRERGVTAFNVVMNETPASSPEGLDRVAELTATGKLIVQIAQVRPLAEAALVLDEIEAGRLPGKILLRTATSEATSNGRS